MTSPHLAERALQEAAEPISQLPIPRLPVPQAAHLRGCRQCQGRVAAYQHLFSAVAQLPPPAFSFDLAAGVLAQLPRAQPAFPWVLSGVAALVLGVVGAFAVLFGGALGQVFQGLATGPGAGLAVVAGSIVAGHCLELLARHRRQMRRLAFS
ncbi:MAG: hypothetical protein ACRYG7_01690 [Janthinobacterium lividum]